MVAVEATFLDPEFWQALGFTLKQSETEACQTFTPLDVPAGSLGRVRSSMDALPGTEQAQV